ncbi:uncharacterized protein LOC119078480 [Bradysia coprophila]|uniref:uncharacterized protein LOC119078480 n=1 Tax=Bradysia coprophila TaxID=38358 RepID=UPI00187DAA82|nr:uncharacterized protein LOC119078480 [Bradysia coprophila]
MNLTVDQMDVLNFRLTEISLELLGNQFFDIFGRKCDTLGSLYRSKSGPATDKFAAGSDLVAALKVEDIFNFTDEPPDETHGDNGRNDNYGNEEISDDSSDESADSDEFEYSDNREQDPSADIKIAQIMNDVEQEYSRLLMSSDSAKMKYFITNKHKMQETGYEDEYEICSRYYQQEGVELLGQSDAFIKLIKHIKCDPRNGLKMGEIAATILKVKDRFIEGSASST